MRFLLILLPVFFANSILNGQTLSGTVKHVDDAKIYLHYSDNNINNKIDTIALDKNGAFSKKLKLNKITKVIMAANSASYTFTLYPGAHLFFETDATSFSTINDSIKIRGQGSNLNIDHKLYANPALKKLNWDYDLPADSFVLRLQQWRYTKDSLRKILVQQPGPKNNSKITAQYLRIDSLNDIYWTMNAFRDYHNFVLGGRSVKDSFFQQYIQPNIFVTDNPDYLAADMYKHFWPRYINNLYEWKLKSADSASVKSVNRTAYQLQQVVNLTSGKLQQMILAHLLQNDFPANYDYLAVSQFAEYDSIFSRYSQLLNNKTVVENTLAAISIKKQNREKTAKGKPAPDFLLTDSSGRQYTLKDFAGKIIYMDAWASWCGPCVAQLPHYNKLVEKFRDKTDVVFISTSIDDTKTAWVEKGLKKHNPPGLQLWAGSKAWRSDFAKDYFIKGVPSYFLIDKQGNIIDFTAPQPSSGQQIEMALDEALKL